MYISIRVNSEEKKGKETWSIGIDVVVETGNRQQIVMGVSMEPFDDEKWNGNGLFKNGEYSPLVWEEKETEICLQQKCVREKQDWVQQMTHVQVLDETGIVVLQ